jgi:hypothetical protein
MQGFGVGLGTLRMLILSPAGPIIAGCCKTVAQDHVVAVSTLMQNHHNSGRTSLPLPKKNMVYGCIA